MKINFNLNKKIFLIPKFLSLIFIDFSLISANLSGRSYLHWKPLLSCPKTPNCVFSQAKDPQNYIDPLTFSDSLKLAKEYLFQVLVSMEGAKVVFQNQSYWRVEFTSKWWKFIDDVEFYFTDYGSLIHFRSASRTGYWDLGVNRRRMEKIRLKYFKLSESN